MGEQVPGLHRLRAGVVTEELGLDLAEDAPVQELVVHVQEILVHERVVAVNGTGERHGLVLGGVELRQFGQRCRGRLRRVAREDEHQAVSFADRIGADTARRPAGPLGQIRYLRDAAVSAVRPGVIATAERVAFHDAHAQRHLAVGAPVLQCVDRAALAAVQRDPLAGERGRERLSPPHAPGHRDRVPEIRVDPDAPKIGHRGPILIRHLVPATRRSSLDGPIFCGERLSHALLPTCRLWQLTDCPLAVQRSTPPP